MSGIINRPFCLQTGTNSSKKFQVQILGFEPQQQQIQLQQQLLIQQLQLQLQQLQQQQQQQQGEPQVEEQEQVIIVAPQQEVQQQQHHQIPQLPQQQQIEVIVINDDTVVEVRPNAHFVVERILGRLGTKGQDEQFHILWAGHGIEEATWEPGRRIRREIPHLVRSYLKRATEEEEQQRQDALELQRREETRRRNERKLARATASVDRQGIQDGHRGPSFVSEQRRLAIFGGYKD